MLQYSLFQHPFFFNFLFFWVRLHFKHFEQSIFSEHFDYFQAAYFVQQPEPALAVGQALQSIYLVGNQSLNSTEGRRPGNNSISAHRVEASAGGRLLATSEAFCQGRTEDIAGWRGVAGQCVPPSLPLHKSLVRVNVTNVLEIFC